MKLLHLDSSINGDNSASRTISAAIVEHLQQADPSIDVTYRDLVADPVPHLDYAWKTRRRFSNFSMPISS